MWKERLPAFSRRYFLRQVAGTAAAIAVLPAMPMPVDTLEALEFRYFPKTCAFLASKLTGFWGPPTGMAHAIARHGGITEIQIAEAGVDRYEAFVAARERLWRRKRHASAAGARIPAE
jgi:hypothetical protein